MRFTDQTGLLQVLKYSSQRLSRIMTVPVTNGYRKLRRLLNPNGFTTRVMSDVRKGSKELLAGQPQSLKDYFAIGNYYIAKKLVVLAAVLMILLPVLYLRFLHPTVQSHFLTKSMVVNTAEMMGYNGKVKLLSHRGGTILYHGPLVEGRITGEGTLYDYNGNLLYQGSFLMEQYEGMGQLFWPNGKPRYIGEFSANQYNGQGTLYTEKGTILYEGSFAAGQYEGPGRLYDERGVILYSGDFAGGEFSGEGTLFQNGSALYRGQFKNGQMEGEGRLFSGDTVIYEGGFSAGAFSGEGRAYDPVEGRLLYSGSYVAGQYEGEGRRFDPETGNLVYEGGFYQGVYEGSGRYFDAQSQQILYEGEFRNGRYDGAGIAYDAEAGVVRYNGTFSRGVYHGEGTLFDPDTGFVVAAGQFRNGKLLVVDVDGGAVIDPNIPDVPDIPDIPDEPDDPVVPDEPDVPDTPDEPDIPDIPDEPDVPKEIRVYRGPVQEDGSMDVYALADMEKGTFTEQFTIDGDSWSVSEGEVLVYEDKTEKIGVVLRTDKSGKTISVDVWNDAAVSGVTVGMTRDQVSAALGKAEKTEKETMGEGRMISISQSNRYFGRLTNLSPDSRVEVWTYTTEQGTVRVVFAAGIDQCLLLEILP